MAIVLLLAPCMKTLQMLLGCSERRTAAMIEATVLDVCYNRAAVATNRVPRLGEFTRSACCGAFDLMILVTHHLLPEPRLGEPTLKALTHGIWAARNRCSGPLFVLSNTTEYALDFEQAGADAVLAGRFNAEELRASLQRVLVLPEHEEPVLQPRWTFAALFNRGGLVTKAK